jgi:hypothetical protein
MSIGSATTHSFTGFSTAATRTQALESACYLDERFIQKGFLGVVSGQGFYGDPNPAFDQPASSKEAAMPHFHTPT